MDARPESRRHHHREYFIYLSRYGRTGRRERIGLAIPPPIGRRDNRCRDHFDQHDDQCRRSKRRHGILRLVARPNRCESDTDTDTDSNSNADADANTDANSDANSNSNADADANSNSNSNSNSDANSDTNTNTHAFTYPNAAVCVNGE